MTSAHVLRDFHGIDLSPCHALVQELDDATKLRWNDVRDKDHADPPRREVLADSSPEGVCVGVRPQQPLEIYSGVSGHRLVRGAQLLDRPVTDGVRGVVEHLADDFPANPRVGRTLDLHDGRHRVLVQEQMVDAPV